MKIDAGIPRKELIHQSEWKQTSIKASPTTLTSICPKLNDKMILFKMSPFCLTVKDTYNPLKTEFKKLLPVIKNQNNKTA